MSTSVFVIDSRLADYQQLLADLPAGADLLVLDPLRDGVQQIADYVDRRSDIGAIHILSHGAEGTLYLGSTTLTSSNLESYITQWGQIGRSLNASGDILLYGCDVAAGIEGPQFMGTLAKLTGADIAASTDLTGLSLLGGNWALEATTGPVEATPFAANGYEGTLANSAPTGTVNYVGTLEQNQTLTANNTLADADGLGEITYHWQSSSNGSDWTEFATGNSVVLAEAQVGKRVRVVATYTDGQGTDESVAWALSGGGFQSQTAYATKSMPYSVATGDFNGDGKADLAVANQGSNTVSVLLSNGGGTFLSQTNYSTQLGPISVTTGDFNGDGKTDLAATNELSDTVSVLLGKGDGTFQNQTSCATQSVPYSVTNGDFNGDGKTDLAVANEGSNSVSVLLSNGDGTFQSQTTYATQEMPYSVATGDFNSDGKTDLVVANARSSTVSVLLGKGDGTFQTQTSYATQYGPTSVATGDFNDDGKTDLAVANQFSATVSVLLGNGDGTFQSQTAYAGGGSVTTGDFNGDGKTDLAVANYGRSNTVSIFLGKGDGTFLNQTAYATQSYPISVTNGDFNGDGNTDLAVANTWSNTVSVLLGNAATVANVNDIPTGIVTMTGSPVQNQTLNAGNTLADADGLGTISYRWQVSVDGTSGWGDISGATNGTYMLTESEVDKYVRVVASYTDGHGTLESVAIDGQQIANVNDAPMGTVTMAGRTLNNQILTAGNTLSDADGLGAISYQWQVSANGTSDWIDLGGATSSAFILTDSEVDKYVRVVASYTDGHGTAESVASDGREIGNVNSAPAGTVTMEGSSVQIQMLTAGNTLADADGLGTISYRWQVSADGASAWGDIGGATIGTYILTESEVGKYVRVVASYTDGHGTLESVASDGQQIANVNDAPTGTVSYVGTLEQNRTLTASNTLADADGLGDITYHWQSSSNGSDWNEFATGNSVVLTEAQVGKKVQVVATYTDGHGADESVASMAGYGFQSQTPYAVQSGWFSYGLNSAAIGDFNGDGKTDLAVAVSVYSSTVEVLLGKGDGTFQSQAAYATQGSPFSVATGDFNGDGKTDLAVTNWLPNSVSVLLGKGDGTFQSQTSYAALSNPKSVTTGDFNGDGKTDLAVTNGDSYTVSILMGNGDGTFQRPTAYATQFWPMSMVTGDFNGDGRSDLAVAAGADSVSILLSNGDGTFQSQTTYATQSNPRSVTTADFNGDGKIDLAVANGTSNTVSVLLGKGDGTFQTQTAYDMGLSPTSVTTGDFNGDGIIDLAVTNGDADTVSVLLGKGDGTFQSQTAFATQDFQNFVETGDFNGDGKTDLVVANSMLKTVSILLGNAGEVANVNEAPTGTVTVAGSAIQKQTLTAGNTLADNDGLGAISYQWQVSANGTGAWSNIGGATDNSYTLTAGEAGKYVRVVASYTDGHGTFESVASTATTCVVAMDVTLIGTSKADTLTGTAGTDILTGGAGTDVMDGGEGYDLYIINAPTEHTAAEINDTGTTGADEVRFAASTASTLTLYAGDRGIEQVTIGTGTGASPINSATTALNVNAAAVNNGLTLIGNAGANILTGTAYNDRLDGGAGGDRMLGGAGNDTYVVDNVGDKVYETTTTSSTIDAGGIDNVEASISYTLGHFVENLTLTGSNAINGTGNALANSLTGNGAANILYGMGGIDTMDGREGSDVYLIASAVEHSAAEIADTGSTGIDEVRFTATRTGTLTLFAGDTGIEQVVIGTGSGATAVTTATTALNVNASAVLNGLTLIGNAGANLLVGTAYGDTLIGGNGNDVLTGGNGADKFVFNTKPSALSNRDTITDFQWGTDVIQLSKAVFTALGAMGTLNPEQFWSGQGAVAGHDADDRIIYNTTTGALYYDADGNGNGTAVQIALLGTSVHSSLAYSDIQITA